MSVVIGIKSLSGLMFGADNCVSRGSMRFKAVNQKIFVKNNILFGSVGRFPTGQLIKHNFDFDKYNPLPIVDHTKDYLVSHLAPALRKELVEYGMSETQNSTVSLDKTELLIGINGKIFVMGSDFSIVEYINHDKCSYMAIGSGEQFALGALASRLLRRTGNPFLDAEDIRDAILIAGGNNQVGLGWKIINEDGSDALTG